MGRKKIIKRIRKRGRNEGTVRLRSDGHYEARVTIGVDIYGKQIQKSIYGKERADVVRKMNEIIMNVQDEVYVEETDYTVNAWITKWLEKYAKFNVKETTLEVYVRYTNTHILPFFGRLKLVKLKTANVQSFINHLDEKGLAPGTIRYILRILRGSLNQAVKEKIVKENVAKACVLPKDIQKEMKTLKPEKLDAFITEAKKNRFYALYMLELSTGLRRGEILGLRWQDINFKQGYVQVQQQVVMLHATPVLQSLKTTYSTRKVYIPQSIFDILEKHQKEQKVKMVKHRLTWNEEDLVFTNKFGKIMCPKNLLRSFRSVLKNAGLEKIRFHDLRHTYALNCLAEGIDIRTLQEQLGHHNASFTIQKYGHSTNDMKKSAADKIGKLLGNSHL